MDTENGSLTIDRRHAERLLVALHERYHRPEFIHPDPLELVLRAEPRDREVVALIASSLALGRVGLILAAGESIIRILQQPDDALRSHTPRDLRMLFSGFQYRFFSGEQLANFLIGMGAILRRYGSLEGCFLSGMQDADTNTLPALSHFVDELRAASGGGFGILLSDPTKGSASKRLHLFLRWLIRRDDVDPGGWRVPSAKLIVPADVHMLRVSRMLGFTKRKQPDLQAALEITEVLREFCPDDPVKFDFSMTRLGIHPDLTYSLLYGPNPS